MMSFSKSFKSFLVSYKPIIINTVNDLFLNSRIRFNSTDSKAILRFRPQKRYKANVDFVGYFLLIIPVSSLGLGTWQIFRKFEKERLIEEFKEIIQKPAVELPKDLEELEKLEFRKIRVRGKFDHSKELYLGPRPQISENPYNTGSTLLSKDKGGFAVITPFKLSDRNLTILVNRGWVPGPMKSPVTRPEGQITEEVELVGIVRLNEHRQPMGMRNMPFIGSWVYRDLYKMAEITGAAPVYLEADKASTVPGGPIGGQTLLEIRNVHDSYIYTWFGLAIISSWMWYKRYLQKKPHGLTYIYKTTA